MAIYETVFIVRPDVPNARVSGITDSLTNLLTENGGTVGLVEQWGIRPLAYPINKNRRGQYVLIAHDSSAEGLNALDRRLKTNEDVLRHLNTRQDSMPQGPTVGMRRSSGDLDRRRDSAPAPSETPSAPSSDSQGQPPSNDTPSPGEAPSSRVDGSAHHHQKDH